MPRLCVVLFPSIRVSAEGPAPPCDPPLRLPALPPYSLSCLPCAPCHPRFLSIPPSLPVHAPPPLANGYPAMRSQRHLFINPPNVFQRAALAKCNAAPQ